MAKPTTKKRTAHVDDASKPGTVLNVETNLLIAKGSVIREFCEDKAEAKRRVGKINDGFNKSAGAKVEKEHLHRSAANDAYRLSAMEDEELHVYLFHFLFYIKDLGLMNRATKQEELFSAGETGPAPSAKAKDVEEGDDDATTQPDKTSTASRVGMAARQVAEQAGASLHSD